MKGQGFGGEFERLGGWTFLHSLSWVGINAT
jgi:hypothetical protein